MTIWIAKRHPRHPYSYGYHAQTFLGAFTIVGTFSSRKEAKAFVDQKMSRRPNYLYTVGKVELKEAAK